MNAAINTAQNASSSRHCGLAAKWLDSARSRLDFTVFQMDSTDEIVVASGSGGTLLSITQREQISPDLN